jgi:hypothetical protein
MSQGAAYSPTSRRLRGLLPEYESFPQQWSFGDERQEFPPSFDQPDSNYVLSPLEIDASASNPASAEANYTTAPPRKRLERSRAKDVV